MDNYVLKEIGCGKSLDNYKQGFARYLRKKLKEKGVTDCYIMLGIRDAEDIINMLELDVTLSKAERILDKILKAI